MLIDIGKVNEYIVQDPFTASDISRIFTQIRNKIWRLLVLDDANAFQQLRLAEGSRYLTSFITHLGQLESTSVIFGMNVSPAVFNGEGNRLRKLSGAGQVHRRFSGRHARLLNGYRATRVAASNQQ